MKARESFPDETFAFRADASTHGYFSPLHDEAEIQRRVRVYSENDSVTEIRVARYRLESVEVAYKQGGEAVSSDPRQRTTIACKLGLHARCNGFTYGEMPQAEPVGPCECVCHAVEPHVDNEGYEVRS